MELAQPVSAPATAVLDPDAAYAHALKAALQAFHAQQPAVMENHCAAALALRPESAHAQQLMGVALHLQGRHAEALPWMDRAAVAQPASTELHINRGEVLRSLQRWPEAEQAFELALTLSPGNAEALNNLGLVLQARGRFDAAEASYRAALQARPGHIESLNNLGTLCQETRRPDEAEACYRQVLASQPGHRNALNNLATIAKEGGRVDEARALYRQVLADAPDFWRSWNSLGQLAKDLGDYDEAIACYRRSLAIAPGNADTLYNVALLELLFGDRLGDNGQPLLAQGFAHYEVRFDGRSQNKSAPKPPELGCPMWRGEPLAGKHIALVREQGLGDQLQFCRYAALMRALGAEVTLIVDGPLVELMQTLDGPTRVIAPGQQRDHVYDYWAFQLSLPHRLGTTLDTVPAATPYLQADATACASWRRKFDALGAGPKIGIVWAGNPEHANNRNRSMNLADLAPLLDLPGAHFVSLQKGAAAVQELRSSPWADLILDLDGDLKTYADTAAVLCELDLLISVDTSVIHLAGALNRPCWALLAHGPDWRWMRGHDVSAWYPSLRLLRQHAPRDWSTVANHAAAALQSWLTAGRPADFHPSHLTMNFDTLPADIAHRLRRWRRARMSEDLGLTCVQAVDSTTACKGATARTLHLLDGRSPDLARQLASLATGTANSPTSAAALPTDDAGLATTAARSGPTLLIDHTEGLLATSPALAAALDQLRSTHHHYALRQDEGWWLLFPRTVQVDDWSRRWLWLLPGDSTVNAAPSLGVAGVTAISMRRRLADSRFATRYFKGAALDVGGGRDSLAVYREFFPLLDSVLVYDMPQGDAQLLDNLPDASFDCVYSSHCLEHLRDPREALRHWLRVLKPGGHLVVNVPDEDLYEQGRWPSRFNSDHKLTFTICKASSWSPVSVNLLDLVRDLAGKADCLSLARIDDGYRYQLAGQGLDQTRTPLAEAAIELVMRKPA